MIFIRLNFNPIPPRLDSLKKFGRSETKSLKSCYRVVAKQFPSLFFLWILTKLAPLRSLGLSLRTSNLLSIDSLETTSLPS